MFPTCATTTGGEAHDFATGMTAAFVLFMVGAGGLLYAWMVATGWWRPALVAFALAIGSAATIELRDVKTTARCDAPGWLGPDETWTDERGGLPAYDTIRGDGRSERDRRATLTDVLFWAGCVGYLLGALTTRENAR